MSNFNNFDLNEKILKTLSEIGFEKPTAIQELAIPKVLGGFDLIASARTGTGKTGAFMLPTLHLIAEPQTKVRAPRALILVPTRELAMQVATEAKKFSKHLPHIKTVCIYGGVPYPTQKKALSAPYDILVATPGRLIDHLDRERIDLSKIQLLVLDEADRMLDMGFVDAVERIAASTPKTRQTLLFSATIDKKIIPISKKLQNNPFEIRAKAEHSAINNIEQRLYYVDNIEHKVQILDHVLENTEIEQAIIFTSTIMQTNQLADDLEEKGYVTDTLNGNMNQSQRTRTIDKFRRGKVKYLIATDVAARGIDVSTVTHVINFDLPFQSEDFIHRVGRTGRAGAKGTAITFSTYREDAMITRINELLDQPMPIHTIPGMEPKPKAAGKPKSRGPSRSGSRSRFGGRRSSERREPREGSRDDNRRESREDRREPREEIRTQAAPKESFRERAPREDFRSHAEPKESFRSNRQPKEGFRSRSGSKDGFKPSFGFKKAGGMKNFKRPSKPKSA